MDEVEIVERYEGGELVNVTINGMDVPLDKAEKYISLVPHMTRIDVMSFEEARKKYGYEPKK